ncbi:MAG: NUDIX domain-containing protein [Halobacterium sp.]
MSVTRACCLLRRDDELLVEERVDPDAGRVYRPVGGRVDDEPPEAVVRDAFEDALGVDLTDVSEVGTYDGTLVFEADAQSAWPYGEEGFTVYDPDSGETTRLAWLHVDDFRKYGETLRPEGLLADL